MGRIITRHYQSDGGAVNIALGGVPNVVVVINLMATGSEDMVLIYFKDLLGEVQITAAGAITWDASTGSISQYDGNAVDTGTSNTDSDPCRVTGGQGITIATGFQDDDDEIIVLAFFTDIDDDLGDVA